MLTAVRRVAEAIDAPHALIGQHQRRHLAHYLLRHALRSTRVGHSHREARRACVAAAGLEYVSC